MEADCTGASYSKLWNLHQLSCGLKIYRREKERKHVEKRNKERTNETKKERTKQKIQRKETKKQRY
jgi:bifunctional pyridoxal-dependent enzyme with beta-cystathionase and maltose regulon repressor activities